MAPVAASLAQSESKKRFFDRLGLDERNKLHRHLYSSMKVFIHSLGGNDFLLNMSRQKQ